MAKLLVMLSPPRSFSSLISTMIGQHPEIYGFPELHLMMRERVAGTMRREQQADKFLGPRGLLRALALLQFGADSAENVLEANNWLQEHMAWHGKDVLAHMMDLAEAKTGATYCLEKSPATATSPQALHRLRRDWPDARYLHVTRHPVNLHKSLVEFISHLPRLTAAEKTLWLKKSVTLWPMVQRNILDFCATLNPGQYLRIRGEDVLADAVPMMRMVAEWLGLRTDDAAIDAMLHPEDSPYARRGPFNAPDGNDPKFIASPHFRPGLPRMGNLDDFFRGEHGRSMDAARRAYLRQIANCLGYQ